MEAIEIPFFLQCFFEFLGTFVMILLGCGVVACTTLKGSKGNGGGWIVITLAWGLAVMCGVFIAVALHGSTSEPAVTLGLAMAGKIRLGNGVALYHITVCRGISRRSRGLRFL